MIAAWRSDTGRVRGSNQDAYLLLEGDYPVYAVADGMGGHLGGDIASAMAIAGLRAHLSGRKPAPETLQSCFEQVNREIFSRQLNDEHLSGMGTTLTLLWEDRDSVLLGHVGDSRAYLLRQGELRQMSTDHSLVGELLRSGAIDLKKAKEHPYRNIITRAVGTQVSVRCDTLEKEKLKGDRWLLCSDGLTEHLCDEQIRRHLLLAPLEEAADRLLSDALAAGGRDNITMLLLEVGA